MAQPAPRASHPGLRDFLETKPEVDGIDTHIMIRALQGSLTAEEHKLLSADGLRQGGRKPAPQD